jgi:ABC-type polysaccharide/polyol phosphate transport system ATPase subunit
MPSLVVDRISKVYRKTSAEFAPWQQLVARWRGESEQRKKSREIWALKDVSFTVEPGTILGVIGPNGAGKTTLLKVLARVTPPTEGRVSGRGLVAPLLELGTGLQPDLTARENVALYAAWHGIPAAQIEARLDEIIDFAELREFIDSPLKYFSSGMYVRLAFSLAINMQPDILLADEILAVGDLTFQERCLQRVEEAGRQGMTVLFVSHDMAAIQRLCDRVIWLNAGRLEADGDPQSVVSRYEESAWTLVGGTAKRGKGGTHVNQHGEILSVRLLSSEGREIGVVQRAEVVDLSLTFSVLTPDVMVRCGFVLVTRGMVAFRSIQPTDLQVREPGIYRATMRIPANLLAEAVYTVKAGVFVFTPDNESHLSLDAAVSFRVYATKDLNVQTLLARKAYGKSSVINGVLAPELDWDVRRERDVVTTTGTHV